MEKHALVERCVGIKACRSTPARQQLSCYWRSCFLVPLVHLTQSPTAVQRRACLEYDWSFGSLGRYVVHVARASSAKEMVRMHVRLRTYYWHWQPVLQVEKQIVNSHLCCM